MSFDNLTIPVASVPDDVWPTVEARFKRWIAPKDERGCANWTGSLGGGGYGIFSIDGRLWKAHRVAYILAGGTIQDGHVVCHKCDNRLCVNPDHLFSGTQGDNMLDMLQKGRIKVGERKGSKLDADKVRAIRSDPRRPVAIAKDYGVCSTIISRIKNGTDWKHVP